MKFKNKSLIVNFSGYTIINLLNSLTPIIILPILTRNLTTDSLGIIDLFTATTIFLTPIIGLSFIQSITKLYFSFKNTSKYLSVLSTCVFILGSTALLLTIFVLYGTNLIAIDNAKKWLISLMVFYVFMNLIIEGFLLLKRNEEDLKRFAIIRLFKAFLDIFLTILMLSFFDDYQVRIYGIMLSSFITSIIVLILLFQNPHIKFSYDKEIVRKIFIYSFPLIFHTFFLNIINYSDRYFVAAYLDVGQLGQYSVIYQICMVMSLLINSFNMAWSPYFMKNMVLNEKKFMTVFNKVLVYYGITLVAFGGILFILVPYIYKYIIGIEFIVDNLIYGTLITAYIFNGIYRYKVNLLFYKEKTILIAKLSFICAAINLVMNYYCIREWGLFGAAMATLVSYMSFYLLLEVILKSKGVKS